MARIGPNGEVVIPKQVRDALGIAPGDRLVVEIDGGKVIVTPVQARTAADLMGVLHAAGPMDVHEGRRDYQDHLIDKLNGREVE